MRFFSTLPLAMLFILGACNTASKDMSTRTIAQAHEKTSHSDSFEKLFEAFLADTEGQLEVVKPFAKTSLQVLKRSYHYLDKFDSELERIHSECTTMRKSDAGAVCESPMDLPDYYKLQASRIVFERQKDKLAYYYQRLLDLANSEDDKIKLVFKESEQYLQQFDADARSERARTARGVLTQWSAELRELIKISTSTEGPISYELAIELFKVKEAAQSEWSELAGLTFKSSDILNDAPDVVEEFESRPSALNSEKEEGARSEDSAEITEVYQQLVKVNRRGPQSIAWKNHTGRSFGRGQWALTYDDGPKSSTTNQILDTLAARGWHATFFWLAKNVKASSNSSVVRRTKNMGMGLAHHSYTHANLGKSGSNIGKEIRDAKSVLESVYGKRLNYFRLPYGSGTKSSRIKNMVSSLNMEHFFWNVDSLDWKKSSAEQIYARTKKQMDVQGKGILLFHDIHQRTVDTTKLIARRMPNLNVIKLENGAGILSKANGSGAATPAAPNPVDTTPAVFERHTRVITASILNVRLQGAGTAACGEFHSGDVVEVIDRNNAGWYRVRISHALPRPKKGFIQHTCADGRYAEGWMSGDSSYSYRP